MVQVWRKRESNLSIDWCITRARAKLRVQDFETGNNFSFNQCHNKEICVFFSGKLIDKSNRKLFSCMYLHSLILNTPGAGRILHSYANREFA